MARDLVAAGICCVKHREFVERSVKVVIVSSR